MLTFLAVTTSLIGGYMVVSELVYAEANRVRGRLTAEFANEQSRVATSALYRNIDQLRLDPGQIGSGAYAAGDAAPAAAAKMSLRQRLDTMLDQANVPLSVQQLLVLSGAVAFVLGAAGVFVGGLLVGLTAATI